MHFTVTTRATPDQVLRALTDMSPRRLQTWSRTLDPATYEVRAQGDTWAMVRESSPGSPFWVVPRYDWSDPTTVRWTLEETSWGGGGDGAVRIAPAPAGGSTVTAEWTYTGMTRRSHRLFIALLQRPPLRSLLARGWRTAFDRFAVQDS
ncbi:hypothetical protein ACQBJO_06965 [Janibacter sp. G349]|uniref:hypothetical protein n=1 Tax=unclassified Janibacter TaxID=2649294 RepID=UPI003B81EBFC